MRLPRTCRRWLTPLRTMIRSGSLHSGGRGAGPTHQTRAPTPARVGAPRLRWPANRGSLRVVDRRRRGEGEVQSGQSLRRGGARHDGEPPATHVGAAVWHRAACQWLRRLCCRKERHRFRRCVAEPPRTHSHPRTDRLRRSQFRPCDSPRAIPRPYHLFAGHPGEHARRRLEEGSHAWPRSGRGSSGRRIVPRRAGLGIDPLLLPAAPRSCERSLADRAARAFAGAARRSSDRRARADRLGRRPR